MTTYTVSAGHTSSGITLNSGDIENDYGTAISTITAFSTSKSYLITCMKGQGIQLT